jgi:hypothetical protein
MDKNRKYPSRQNPNSEQNLGGAKISTTDIKEKGAANP